jgi:hypothetical protein
MSIGGFFALIQWISSKKLRRAEFIDQIINKIQFDKENSETMYMIYYNHNWYTNDFHNSISGFEYKIDKLLSYIDYICYLYNTKNITNNEFKVLKYRVNRICISPSVQKYLWNLYHWSKKNKTDCLFAHIIDYGIENGFIKREFKINNNLYDKYLNF